MNGVTIGRYRILSDLIDAIVLLTTERPITPCRQNQSADSRTFSNRKRGGGSVGVPHNNQPGFSSSTRANATITPPLINFKALPARSVSLSLLRASTARPTIRLSSAM